MLFIFALVAALVQSRCEDRFPSLCTGNEKLCSSPGFVERCPKTCGKCTITAKCVDCLSMYFRVREEGATKDQATGELLHCRDSKGIDKEMCDADPCYQNDYKQCRKANIKMEFEEWVKKCTNEAKECAERAAMNKEFCAVDTKKCKEDLQEYASDHCDTKEQCISDVPVAIKCAACITNKKFDKTCLEKGDLTADQCQTNYCVEMFLEDSDYCRGSAQEKQECESDNKHYLFRCAESPRMCMISENEVGYQVGRECCSAANSAWDESFTRVEKCCERGADPNTADGCAPPLPCIKAGETLPPGRECCPRTEIYGNKCVGKAQVCEPCDCGHWDGKNYSICIPRPRKDCKRYCVQCENDGVTPMKGIYTTHKAQCEDYKNSDGIAEAELKDLLRELLF